MYCELHDQYNCKEYHGPMYASLCEDCGEGERYREGLCWYCWHSTNENYELGGSASCLRGCGKGVYAEGRCYVHYTYSR